MRWLQKKTNSVRWWLVNGLYYRLFILNGISTQPPSGGCELKPDTEIAGTGGVNQPPSGGCELKPLPQWATPNGPVTSRLRAAVS